MDKDSGIDSPSQAASARAPEPLRFTGSGAEYFGIWIVNLLLTIVTLGLYSAWAQGAAAAVLLSARRTGRIELRFSRQPDQDPDRTRHRAGHADCL